MNTTVRIFRPDASGRFLSRINRFVVRILLDEGGPVDAHAPNPGRLQELYIPGNPVLLERSHRPGRKLPWTLAAIRHRESWVPMVSAAANRIAGELLLPDIALGRLGPAARLRAEVPRGTRRFDFLAESSPTGDDDGGEGFFVEVKSCSLVEEGLGLFPDAPSIRASEHVNELASIARAASGGAGPAAMILFVVNHSAPRYLAPNYHNDPRFARELAAARTAGAEVLARTVTCGADGWARPAGGDPEVLTDAAVGIIEADTGIILRFSPAAGGSGWEAEVTEVPGNFDAAVAEAARQAGSAKNVIPVRCLRSGDAAESFARLLGGMRGNFPGPPLEDRTFNEGLFSLRHRISLEDLLGAPNQEISRGSENQR
jgi:sugar fermentation stimulation protein